MLAEYQNIAEAHFRTIETISSFFRYYLIIMAIPITLYSGILSLSPGIVQFLHVVKAVTAIISLVIASVGVCVFLYVVNLRMDAILYARTVNSIRKHFFDMAPIDKRMKVQTRVLPQTASVPAYFEGSYFLAVAASFAIFNSLYLFVGLFLLSVPNTSILELSFLKVGLDPTTNIIFFAAALLALGHIVAYWRTAQHREHAYLRSYAVGVDIDGVLNNHRKHFCDLLLELCDKKLDPEEITTIPVHEEPSLNVTKREANVVFNSPRYWVDMPSLVNSAYNISKLRNAFRLRIHIFSYRPWPTEEIRKKKDYERWVEEAISFYKKSRLAIPAILRKLQSRKHVHFVAEETTTLLLRLRMKTRLWPLRLEPVDFMTKCWLNLNGFSYDDLTIEKGSESISDPQGPFHNRFYISRKKKIRFFVEDDHEKASKLAYICDIVFLIEHPYNKGKEVPDNVLRVQSWSRIFRLIRELS
jgi:uncharacterized HAD superfamily protein